MIARLTCSLVLAAGVAHADSIAPDAEGAPAPGEESGRVDGVAPGDSEWRAIGRVALLPLRLLATIGLSPIRGTLWAVDRYHLVDVYYRTLYNDDRTIGVVPTAAYATGFGLMVGLRAFDKDLAGEGEHVEVAAGYGGSYRVAAALWLGTGQRLGRFELEGGGNFDRRPDEPFYGTGNLDLGPQPAIPVDPFTTPTGFKTYMRYQEARAAIAASVHADALKVTGRGELARFDFDPSTRGTPIEEVFLVEGLPGFVQSARHLYGELDVRWDTRRAASPWEPRDVYSTGWLVEGFAGRVHAFDDDPDFWHYGAEVQHYVRLAPGPRALAIRLRGDGVSGRDEVPLVELPALGGDHLRGYSYGRFRDRLAAVGTLQYLWDLSHYLEAYVFVDAGRVYGGWDDVTLDGMRVGYGIGCEVHDGNGGFIVEGSIASSIDGGITVNAAFSPVLTSRPRWR